MSGPFLATFRSHIRCNEAPGCCASLGKLLVVDPQIAEAARFHDADERTPQQSNRNVDRGTTGSIVKLLASEEERSEHGQLERAALRIEIFDVVLHLQKPEGVRLVQRERRHPFPEMQDHVEYLD